MVQTLTADDLTAIVGAVLGAVAANYNAAGSIGAAINTNTVALTTTQANSVASGTLAVRTHHTFSQALTCTSTAALNTATKVWLVVKEDSAETDAKAVINIEATAGLTILAKAAYVTIAHGTLVVGGVAGAWTVTVGLDEVATGLLTAYVGKTLLGECKAKVGNDTVAVWDGACEISRGIVQAVA